MPIGGKLVLKGGEALGGGVQKKKKKKSRTEDKVPQDEQPGEHTEGAIEPAKAKPIAPTAVNVMSGKNYEQEFEFETERSRTGKARSTPWGSTYRKAPEILHGYTHKITGATAEERLDMRSSTKADKFCK